MVKKSVKEKEVSKQEKIKVGLSRIKLSDISYDGKTQQPHFLSPIDIESVLNYLDSQGVVIKVSDGYLEGRFLEIGENGGFIEDTKLYAPMEPLVEK